MYKMGTRKAWKQWIQSKPDGIKQKEILELIAHGGIVPISTRLLEAYRKQNPLFAEWCEEHGLIAEYKKSDQSGPRQMFWKEKLNFQWYQIKQAFEEWRQSAEIQKFEGESGRILKIGMIKLSTIQKFKEKRESQRGQRIG